MPIYEYECQKCGHYLEALQKIADKPLRECPECGKHALKRLVSAPMFRLSGSGWYETDFKSDQERKRNLVDNGDRDAAKSESKEEAKSESKVDAKADAKSDDKSSKTEPKVAEKTESRSSRSRTTVTKPSRAARPARTAARAAKKNKSKAKR
jgi:putative FmdB family regulatory protein